MNAVAQMSDSQDAASVSELHVGEGRERIVRGEAASRAGSGGREAGAPSNRQINADYYEVLGRNVWIHLRITANQRVHEAVKKGLLPSLRDNDIRCTDCPDRATSYDHRDYTRPLDVVPVCHPCNRKRGKAELDFNHLCALITKAIRA